MEFLFYMAQGVLMFGAFLVIGGVLVWATLRTIEAIDALNVEGWLQ